MRVCVCVRRRIENQFSDRKRVLFTNYSENVRAWKCYSYIYIYRYLPPRYPPTRRHHNIGWTMISIFHSARDNKSNTCVFFSVLYTLCILSTVFRHFFFCLIRTRGGRNRHREIDFACEKYANSIRYVIIIFADKK